jgi:hypothetical protein
MYESLFDALRFSESHDPDCHLAFSQSISGKVQWRETGKVSARIAMASRDFQGRSPMTADPRP